MDFALAGLFLGGNLYTYLSGMFVPLAAMAFLIYVVWRARSPKLWSNLAAFAVVSIIVALPIGLYFWNHPDSFARRAGQVSDFRFIMESRDFGPLATDTLNTLGMFVVRGDPSSRYNLASRPVFDLLASGVFLVGLLAAARRVGKASRALPEVFVLIWLATMLIPSATTGESPHFWRAVGAIPPTFILLGIGADILWRFAESRLSRVARFGLPVAAVLVFGFTAVATYHDFFIGWANDAEARDIYRAEMAELAAFVDGWDEQGRLLVSAEYPYDLDRVVLQVLRQGRQTEATWFNGRETLVLPLGETTPAYYFFPSFAMPSKDLRDRYFGSAERYSPVGARAVEPALLYRLQPSALAEPRPSYPGSMRFGGLELLGYDVVGDEGIGANAQGKQPPDAIAARHKLTVVFYWKLREKPEANAEYSFFAHLRELGSDVEPEGHQPLPPEHWRVGDVIVNRHEIAIPPGTPPNP